MESETPAGSGAAPRPRAPRAPRAAKTPAKAASQPASAPQQLAARPAPEHRRQQKIGRVSSDKMQKTIVVAVESIKRHPVYKRTYKYTTKFKAHDEHNSARLGDTVRIEETRPLSKEKRWRLVEILKRAEQTVAPEVVEEQLEASEGIDPSVGTGGGTGR
jgi:small subunit ribosomal protein S17